MSARTRRCKRAHPTGPRAAAILHGHDGRLAIDLFSHQRAVGPPDHRWYLQGVTDEAKQQAQWEAEFEAARRRPLRQRFKYAFIRTYKPVLDDATYRSFDTMEEYRTWCNANLPSWLGYGVKAI